MKRIIKSFCIKIFMFILSMGIIITLVFIQGDFTVTRMRDVEDGEQGFVVGDNNVTLKTDAFLGDIADYIKNPFVVRIGYAGSTRALSEFINNPLKRTLILLLPALIFSIVIGMLMGILGARLRKGFLKNLHLTTTIGLMSIPDIFLILVIQYMVVWMYRHDIHWFRVIASDDLKSLILPFFLLSLIPTNYISRITTVAIEKQQNKKFVMIAKAKGLKRSAILLVHIMKNAVIEVLGAFPSMFIILISCQVLVEYMFAYPGLAYMMFSSGGEEEAVIGASFLLVSFYYIFVLLVDLTKYGFSPYKKTGVLADSVLELALEADEKEAYDD